LPVIEEAWNLPISAEMTARQQQQQQSQRQAMYAQQQKGNNGINQHSEVPAKRFKVCC
jgi:histone demethylase